MIGLSSKIQKVSWFGAKLTKEIICSHTVSSTIADDSNVASFHINVSQLIITGDSLNKWHLGEIPIHHYLLLSKVRVDVYFNFGVICE
jgi:hypothetical protein